MNIVKFVVENREITDRGSENGNPFTTLRLAGVPRLRNRTLYKHRHAINERYCTALQTFLYFPWILISQLIWKYAINSQEF